jgi:hypothetical protein
LHSLIVHTRPKYQLVDIGEQFELALICPFQVLRERIAQFINHKVPASAPRDTKAAEYIRLYTMDKDEPVSIVHEPILTTLK